MGVVALVVVGATRRAWAPQAATSAAMAPIPPSPRSRRRLSATALSPTGNTLWGTEADRQAGERGAFPACPTEQPPYRAAVTR
jgi:hypothetical protein